VTSINGGVLDGVRRIGAAVRSLSITGGISGAPLGVRLFGANASGAPKTGTWKAGDMVPDRTGVIWICTAGGTPGTWTSAAALALPLTGGTMSGAIAMGANKVTGLANGSGAQDAAAFGQINALLATTGASGFALQNGTPNVLTWTAPNDGNMHRVLVMAVLHCTSTETGGAVSLTFTLPDGTSGSKAIFAANNTTGAIGVPTSQNGPAFMLIEANTTIALVQTSALTGGAAVVFAEFWGS